MDRQSRLLPLIAAFKIAKACLLFTVALGLHHLWRGNTLTILDDWMRDVRIDPDNSVAHSMVSKLTGLPPHRLYQLGVGTFFYGSMFMVEGIGLLLKKRWAEYMTVITTTTFLPLEIFELAFRPDRKVFKAVLLALNLIILIYLLWNLRKTHKGPEPATQTGTI